MDVYDLFILGQISDDINIDYDGHTIREVGGAVIYSGFAAAAMEHRVAVLVKGRRSRDEAEKVFDAADSMDIYTAASCTDTSIENRYLSQDKERRISAAISRIEAYKQEDIPDIDASIFHLAGLMKGDIPDDIIDFAASRSKVALDVQGVVRCEENKSLIYRDWENKKKYIPIIDFLKTDAAEAQILTGCSDRLDAAKILAGWGAKEIMITHNTEVLIYKDGKAYTRPLRPRNLSGRSGRGDTCFSTYITERLKYDVPEALLTAAAAVSMKMENPGPLRGGRKDVEEYIRNVYCKGETC